MTRFIAQALVIARRDFMAIAGTPTFLIFLLAPFFMLAISAAMGVGAASLATKAGNNMRIVAIAPEDEARRLVLADRGLRALYPPGEAPPPLVVIAPLRDHARQREQILSDANFDTRAILSGNLDNASIQFVPPSRRLADYLAALAERARLDARAGLDGKRRLTTPRIASVGKELARPDAARGTGIGAVFVIFLLTLVLGGQTVGMLAEEKSNKVIEILAASVRLEAVFLGKLIGMFGVAVLFVAFWGILIGAGLGLLPEGSSLAAFAPAVGLPTFLLLCAAYFTMAFMLLGAIFLGVGAQASTMREIQMLSLPITIFQVAMFGLSSAAAADPDSRLASFAQIFPFSSPFAMAARAANESALWPHALALGWQALWVAIVIFVAARLFRMGVLKSGGGWRGMVGLRPVIDRPVS